MLAIELALGTSVSGWLVATIFRTIAIVIIINMVYNVANILVNPMHAANIV